MEQVKGSEEMKEKIIAAAREARRSPEYPQELLPDLSNSVCDRYLNNYQNNHVQGKDETNVDFHVTLLFDQVMLGTMRVTAITMFGQWEPPTTLMSLYIIIILPHALSRCASL